VSQWKYKESVNFLSLLAAPLAILDGIETAALRISPVKTKFFSCI
jgi:hypothetical protein